ncbi:glutamate--cysteine ligase [Comamonas flocculans]|uniref:Glutamate--cysteine ligase n=1 Tax=Comamonas flocculans TaxID=2597701 RepID=A0A5B8RPM9_9BURK|nr:glutamate--cysteine ligase [Comamonas flocculans]QEA11609.1 glutamate--cysteine ligase [Comamonas flocculans]
MSTLQARIAALGAERLRGMRRGIEKEGLRVLPSGQLALTPHPGALGAALTHPSITTDYSESLLELITRPHASVQDCAAELAELHQAVEQVLARQVEPEILWNASMPCRLPPDETIPLGRYGSSNIGRAKSVYRMGLGHRYGRRMQTIAGIHYNWSLPGVGTDEYFGLIRNFRRHSFVLLYLFGASPALAPCFVRGREHGLQPLGDGRRGMGLPHATSLRMGRLGYQSDAQASLAVSYNGLQGFAASLYDALTQPYPAYEAMGVRSLGGDYNQLGTSLLQIENEFYGTIRAKRTVRSGERPLHALRERGVEYVEVRLMDINPLVPTGISMQAMRVLDVFLLHCLLSDSPPDTPEEISALKHNQHLTAERGREPGLRLSRGQEQPMLVDWAAQVLDECVPIADRLDALLDTAEYGLALNEARALLQRPEATPSARVLAEITGLHDNDYIAFATTRSLTARQMLLSSPWTRAQEQHYCQLASDSFVRQRAMEEADTLNFEDWLVRYMAEDQLVV